MSDQLAKGLQKNAHPLLAVTEVCSVHKVAALAMKLDCR